MPWWGVGTCILVTVRVLLYRFVLTSWGVGGFVCLLPGGVYANFFWCGAFIYGGGACYGYGDYLVWGLCVFEPFYRNIGFACLGLRLHLFCVSGTRFVNCYRGVT